VQLFAGSSAFVPDGLAPEALEERLDSTMAALQAPLD